ncbi:MAG: hypothetical protein OEL83_18495 [Desulforhopalus sp.]|nr:hypothetical protein [Desulforhopalus sp.]
MDNVEKLRVMLQHWIEHNKGHMDEFEKWRTTMSDEGRKSLAGHIQRTMELMASVNVELGQALQEAGGTKHDDDHHHHHHDGGHHHH